MIAYLDSIIREYQKQGYVLTVRQLYYQCVARGVIENTLQEYKRLANLINEAKLAGHLDWDALEDRTRDFVRRSRWETGSQIIEAVSRQFHMDMWDNQEYRVFVIVEKEALVGVLQRPCHQFDVPLLAARGYPSGSVLRAFAQEDLIPCFDSGQQVLVLHLGDHDPSGIDMSRDLEERLGLFCGTPIEFERIALSMEQIEDAKPPENPAKATDSRYEDYRRKFGDSSWELDALSPEFLTNLVTSEIESRRDPQKWEEREDEIASVKENLAKTAAYHYKKYDSER